jgi:hypothetical protein
MERSIERNKKRKHKQKSSTAENLGSKSPVDVSADSQDLVRHSVLGSREKHGPKVRSSWSAAFTAAASVQPIALDEEFIRRTDGGSRNTCDPNQDDDEDTEGRDREDLIGSFKISQLASDFYHSKPSSLDPPSLYHKQQDPTTTLDIASNKVKDKKRKKKRKRDTLEKDKQDASIPSQGPSLKSDPTSTGTLHSYCWMLLNRHLYRSRCSSIHGERMVKIKCYIYIVGVSVVLGGYGWPGYAKSIPGHSFSLRFQSYF